ncbi:MAG: phosphoribosylglycinamide formyltransferase [Clostridia bacterium]|nr:phosphoribosylglycinamide formyltransferase [Clostridia bacterium]
MLNIVVLVSGGGTNLQALIDAQNSGSIKNGKITNVISDKEGAFALTRAENAGIATSVIARKSFASIAEHNKAILNKLLECKADLIVLAGYLSILDKEVTDTFKNKIINVHPSLIPAFCGDGFYGLRVHKAVLEKGVKITGATVHFVNEITDGGAIILQKAVEVQNSDTPEILQKRIMEQAEWEILPKAVSLFCEGRINVTKNITQID